MVSISEENLDYILGLARNKMNVPFQICKLTPEEILEAKTDAEMVIIETDLVVKLDTALTRIKKLEDIIRSQSVWKLIKLKFKLKIRKLRE